MQYKRRKEKYEKTIASFARNRENRQPMSVAWKVKRPQELQMGG